MTNTINISVTNGNMSPRFIEVGAEGQEGIIKLSLSFDDGWSGLAKSVVFYDNDIVLGGGIMREEYIIELIDHTIFSGLIPARWRFRV